MPSGRNSANRRNAPHRRGGKADRVSAPPLDRWGAHRAVRSLTPERWIGVSAEVAHRSDVHVVDVPSLAGTLNHVESRLPGDVAFLQLHAELAMTADPGRLSENPIRVMREEAGEDHLSLLQLRSVHGFARRSGLRSEHGRHRLDVGGLRAFEELLDGETWRGGAGNLAGRRLPRRARASGEKGERGHQSETHHTI